MDGVFNSSSVKRGIEDVCASQRVSCPKAGNAKVPRQHKLSIRETHVKRLLIRGTIVEIVGVCRLQLGEVDEALRDIAKEMVRDLPPFRLASSVRVLVADTVSKAIGGVKALRERLRAGSSRVRDAEGVLIDVLGFDTETKPNFCKGLPRNGVALIQLATPDLVVLFRICNYHPPPALHALLNDDTVLKVGVAATDDAWRLGRNGAYCDVEKLVAARYPSLKRCGLRYALASIAKVALTKKQSTANWERHTMTSAMVCYAANDALAGLYIFDKCIGAEHIFDGKDALPLSVDHAHRHNRDKRPQFRAD